jgi:hypothetical protein
MSLLPWSRDSSQVTRSPPLRGSFGFTGEHGDAAADHDHGAVAREPDGLQVRVRREPFSGLAKAAAMAARIASFAW